jgi:CRISPR/Cas system-associated protein Csm6
MNGIIYCRPHFEQLVKQKGVSDRVWGGVSDLVNESARVYRRGVRPDRSPPSR